MIAAGLLVEGSDVVVEGVGLNPTRTGVLDVLRRMEAELEVQGEPSGAEEPRGSVRARAGGLVATEISGAEVPGVIDELPILAVLASAAQGRTVVRDAGELAVKESDRIAGIVDNLNALGGSATACPDGFEIEGPARLGPGVVEARGDHRIAMSFAVAALAARGPVRIEGWECVDTSFPGFLETLRRLGAP